MYYELYIDVIFIINFMINVYVLQLLNHSYRKAATFGRVILGGFVGALLYCILVMIPVGNWGVRNALGVLISGVGMLFGCFRIRTVPFFLEIAAKAGGYYVLFGGIWMLLKRFPLKTGMQIVVMGIVTGIIVIWKREKEKGKERGIYPVKIIHKGNEVGMEAFLDTGNHLYEPVSGKPVSVISEKCLEAIYENELPDIYRVIPFQSVGKGHGIMKGYPVENMIIRIEGTEKSYQDIYVCVSDEISFENKGYQMILHPDFNV